MAHKLHFLVEMLFEAACCIILHFMSNVGVLLSFSCQVYLLTSIEFHLLEYWETLVWLVKRVLKEVSASPIDMSASGGLLLFSLLTVA